MLLFSENIAATHNKHAWETGKSKNVEISAHLGMRKVALKSIERFSKPNFGSIRRFRTMTGLEIETKVLV